jgi:hypothetical protein
LLEKLAASYAAWVQKTVTASTPKSLSLTLYSVREFELFVDALLPVF